MPIIIFVIFVIMWSLNSSAMTTKVSRIYLRPGAYHMSISTKDSHTNQNPWSTTRKNFLDARTSKNHDIFNNKIPDKSKLLDINYNNNDPLLIIKKDIKEIFSGTKLSDSAVDAGEIARKELEKFRHIEPDMGTRWRACQLTAMGLYLLRKIYGGKFPDDIAVILYLLQIKENDQIRDKRYMVRALQELGIYDYVANEQFEKNNIYSETISLGQYNKLLNYLRNKLQKIILDAIYDSSDQDSESYALLESNSEWVPKDREEAFSEVLEKLEQEKSPIVIALYPGTPSQSEVRTLNGVGFIYLYRYSDSLNSWQLVSTDEADKNGYFIIHAGLAQYGINAQKFITKNSIEVLTPPMNNIDPIELMEHRFNLVNSSSEDFQPEHINSWPYPELSVFHFSFRLGPIKDLKKKVSEREIAYCRPALVDEENIQLNLSLIDFECEDSTPLFVEENVQDYYAKDPENTPRKQRKFNKPGLFLYKILDKYRCILRLVPNHPESSYFVVQKRRDFGIHGKKGQRREYVEDWETYHVREKFESFLKMLLLYHETNLCLVTRIILNRNGLTKEAIEKHLQDIEYIYGKSNRPFEKSYFLNMYISKKDNREWSFKE